MTTAPTIAPALQPAEWAVEGIADRGAYAVTIGRGPHDAGCVNVTAWGRTIAVPNEIRHALAALALDGQAFGFTAAGVAALERVVAGVLREGDATLAAAEVAKARALLRPGDGAAVSDAERFIAEAAVAPLRGETAPSLRPVPPPQAG